MTKDQQEHFIKWMASKGVIFDWFAMLDKRMKRVNLTLVGKGQKVCVVTTKEQYLNGAPPTQVFYLPEEFEATNNYAFWDTLDDEWRDYMDNYNRERMIWKIINEIKEK